MKHGSVTHGGVQGAAMWLSVVLLMVAAETGAARDAGKDLPVDPSAECHTAAAPGEEAVPPENTGEFSCAGAASPSEVQARQAELAALPVPDWVRTPQRAVTSIYAGGQFGRLVPEPGLRWEWRFDSDEPDPPGKLPDWLKAVINAMGQASGALGVVAHVVLWSLLLLTVIALWRVWRRYEAARIALPADVLRANDWLASPMQLADALPDDVITATLALWRTERQRDALSLLYRAALVQLGGRYGFQPALSATEGECLRLVRHHVPAAATAFAGVVNIWTQAAWNHQAPDTPDAAIAAYRATLSAGALSAAGPQGGART